MSKENLEEFAYSAIMELLRSNHFKPGDFILETELAEMLELKSRTPVRHALGQLVAKGFLQKKKKKGCFIAPTNPDDARHVFLAREYIESAAAYSAAIHADGRDISELNSIVSIEAETGKAGKKRAYSDLNERFHYSIMRISRNQYLQRYADYIFWRSNIYIHTFGGYYTQKDHVKYMLSPPQHIAILDAITEGNGPAARKLMVEHISFTFKKIFNLI